MVVEILPGDALALAPHTLDQVDDHHTITDAVQASSPPTPGMLDRPRETLLRAPRNTVVAAAADESPSPSHRHKDKI
eukprot:365608-Chlamydomonas_euryale.AAC.34